MNTFEIKIFNTKKFLNWEIKIWEKFSKKMLKNEKNTKFENVKKGINKE